MAGGTMTRPRPGKRDPMAFARQLTYDGSFSEGRYDATAGCALSTGPPERPLMS